jgi:hypothetical protein
MKYKTHEPIEFEHPIYCLLSDKNLAVINAYLENCGYVPYTRERQIKTLVKRKQEKQSFWDRLMRQVPGFDRGQNGI